MAEPGKAEEPQRTEASAIDVEEFTVRGDDEAVRAAMTALLAVGMVSVQSVVGRGGQGKTAALVRARAPEEWERAFESLSAVETDDAYYEDVRQAVGRGTPSLLLGTSTRSLQRSFRKLKAVQQANADPAIPSVRSQPADLTEILRQSVEAAKATRAQPPKKD
jgi:hypothetical protein